MDLGEITLADHLSNKIILLQVNKDDRIFEHLDPLVNEIFVLMVELLLSTFWHENKAIYIVSTI